MTYIQQLYPLSLIVPRPDVYVQEVHLVDLVVRQI